MVVLSAIPQIRPPLAGALVALLAAAGCSGDQKQELATAANQGKPHVEQPPTLKKSASASIAANSALDEGRIAPQQGTSSWADEPLPATVAELFAQARSEGRELADRYPNTADALEVQARLELATGRYREAAAVWRRLLEQTPDYAYAHHGLGQVAARLGEFEQAAEHHLAAIELMPSLSEARHMAADTLTKLGRTDEAKSILREYLQIHPDDAATLARLGQTNLAALEYAEAQDAFSQALAHDDSIPQASYGLAVALARLNQHEQAQRARDHCARLRRRQRATEAQERRRRNDFDASARRIAPLLVQAAAVCQAQRDVGEMERLLRRAAQLDATNVAARTRLASHYMQVRRAAPAIQACRELAAIESENAAHPLNLGFLHLQQNNLQQARTQLQRALLLAPENVEAHFLLATASVRSQRLEEAADHARRAAQLSDSAACYGLLAEILYQQQQPALALEAIDEALRREPDNGEFLQLRARLRPN